jgi:DNA-binding CsgD family transcriptional regulator
MIRLSCRDLEACSNAVRDLYAESVLESFPRRALEILSRLVPVEYVSYNEVGLQPRELAVEYLPKQPDAARLLPQLATHFDTHPLVASIYSMRPRRIIDVTSVRQFRETPVFREYYRFINVTNQMIFGVGDGRNSRIVIALNRTRRCFSEREQGVVAFLSPHLGQAYHNARANAQLATEISEIGHGLAALERAVVFATTDGRIIWCTDLAREWLLELFPDSAKSGMHLPQPFVSRMSSLEPSSGERRKSFFDLQIPSGPEQQLTARCVTTSPGKFIVVLERERTAIGATLAHSLGLTGREGEILFWISEAKTDRDIAMILGISPRTVHKHVEHLFNKLGINTRAAAQRLGADLRRI